MVSRAGAARPLNVARDILVLVRQRGATRNRCINCVLLLLRFELKGTSHQVTCNNNLRERERERDSINSLQEISSDNDGKREIKRKYTFTGVAATVNPETKPPTTRPSAPDKVMVIIPDLPYLSGISVGVKDPEKERISKRP